MDRRQKSAGLDGVLDVWRRRKWPGIVVLLSVFTAVLSTVAVLPDIYQSKATILIERQEVPESFVKSIITSSVDSRLQTISQEVLSRPRLEGLIQRFGLYEKLRAQVPLEMVIERMRNDFDLEIKSADQRDRDRTTVAFSISYRGIDPQKVALTTDALTSFYIEENLKVRAEQASGTVEFLQVQLEEMREKLLEQERLVSEFKEKHLGELPEQQEANLATLEGLRSQLRLNGDKQILLQEKHELLSRQLNALVTAGSDREDDSPGARLALMTQQLLELRTRFNDNYPEVVRVQAEIAALERQIAEGGKKGGKPSKVPTFDATVARLQQDVTQTEAELKGLHNEEAGVQRAIALYQQRVENTPKREQEFRTLARDYETTKELYRSLLTRQSESQVAESMEQRQKGEQFRILEPATVSEQPAAPDRIKLVLMGAILALGLAVGLVILLEQVDSSFHTADALRTFAGAPVLVSIPRIMTPTENRHGWWRVGVGSVVLIVGLAVLAGSVRWVAAGNEQLVGMLAKRGVGVRN